MSRKYKKNGVEVTTALDKTKKYKYDSTGDLVESTGTPGANEIVMSGSKSNLRRMADMERNIAILATTLTTTDDGVTDSSSGSFASNVNKKTRFKKEVRMDTALNMQATIDMNGDKITDLGTPTAGTDAAHKTYVDSAETDAIATAESKDVTRAATASTDATTKADAAELAAITSAETKDAVRATAANAYADAAVAVLTSGASAAFDTLVEIKTAMDTGDTTLTDSIAALNHDTLSGFVANEHIDWTVTGNTVHADNYTDTTYAIADGQLSQVSFTTADNSKLDAIADLANNYSHPGYDGDDFTIDTLALTGATIVSDIDINVTTDTSGHVTDANGTVSTRELTLADLGYTGATDANKITNNSSLTNGAGYITSYTDTTYIDSDFNHDSLTGFVAAEHLVYTGGTNVTVSGTGVIASTDTNTTYVNSDWHHDSLTGYAANEHLVYTGGTNVTVSGVGVISSTDTNTETTTTLSHNGSTKTLTYVDEVGNSTDINLTAYVDDTNLARLTSGTLNSSTGIATFTRDDASTFTIDFSALFDDVDTTYTAGTNVSISAGNVISSTDTNTQRSVSDSVTSTSSTVGASSAAAKAAYDRSWPNTTYSVGDGGLTTKNFTTALKDKLDGIEAGADHVDTANVSSAGALMKTGGTMSGNIAMGGNDITGAGTFYGVATTAQYADLAERYAADATYEEGTVVMFGGEAEVTSATGYGSTKIAGVVSTKPAYGMNSEAGNSETHPYIALQGRVPVKVIGPVSKGDILVASELSGVATVWLDTDTDPRMTAYIGIAIEDKALDTAGYVEVKVGK